MGGVAAPVSVSEAKIQITLLILNGDPVYEWSELQEEKKNNDEKKEDAKEDKEMNFAELIEFVKDN